MTHIEQLRKFHAELRRLNGLQEMEIALFGKATPRYCEIGLEVCSVEREISRILWEIAGWL